VLLSLPVSVRLIRVLRTAAEIPADADPKTANAAMLFGGLLIASLLLERIGSTGVRG
jgi:hypothetical protein